LILRSPGCKCLLLSDLSYENLDRLIKEIIAYKIKRFNDFEVMRNEIKDSVVFTKKDEERFNQEPLKIPTKHDIRNDIGPAIFLKEFCANIEQTDPLSLNYEKVVKRLEVKKLLFLRERLLGQTRLTRGDVRYPNWKISNKGFILIDDEHQFGWSYAIGKGLFNWPQNVYEDIKKKDGIILCMKNGLIEKISSVEQFYDTINNDNNEGGFLLCIPSFQKGKEFFDCIKEKVNSHLQEYVKRNKEMLELYQKTYNPDVNAKQQLKEKIRDINKKLCKLDRKLKNCYPFDLVFLDLRLCTADWNEKIKHTSGIKLLKQIKKLESGVPIILLTASERAESLKEAIIYGADGYWTKCIDSGKNLWEIIEQCLKKVDILKSFWIKMKQVEQKSGMFRWRWKIDGPKVEYISGSNDKCQKHEEYQEIISSLRQALLLLTTCYNLSFQMVNKERIVFDGIAVLMRRIQEIRHRGAPIRKPKWLNLAKKYNIPRYKEEQTKIKDVRNRIHPYHKEEIAEYISEEEAIEAIRFTFERLLNSSEVLKWKLETK